MAVSSRISLREFCRGAAREKAATEIFEKLELLGIQQLVGVLLLLCRYSRSEIAYGVGLLASRVHSWGADASLQLLLVISYVRKCHCLVLYLKMHRKDDHSDLYLVVDSDSDFSAQRSQSSGCVYLNSDRGSRIPLDCISRGMAFVADSTSWGEFTTAHTSIELASNGLLICGDLAGELGTHYRRDGGALRGPITDDGNSSGPGPVHYGYSGRAKALLWGR